MPETIDIALAGAAGPVGEALLEALAAAELSLGTLYPLADSEGAGERVEFRGRRLMLQEIAGFDFGQVRIALFAPGVPQARDHALRAAAAGCIVVDASGAFVRDDDIPLVVADVNPEAIALWHTRNIVAVASPLAQQLLMALKPIHDAAGIVRINVATYEAVSGEGAAAVEELARQISGLLNFREVESTIYPQQIAFNVLTQVEGCDASGYTADELRLVHEVRRVLGEPELPVNPTTVRVPVFYGHSQVINVETREKITVGRARDVLHNASGVDLFEESEPGSAPSAVTDASGSDRVLVGRLREDLSHPQGLDLWVVADNIRRGIALNSVQIVEILVKSYLQPTVRG